MAEKTKKYDCVILNYWHVNNYGAVLTAFALQEALHATSYSCALINNSINTFGFAKDFADKYFTITHKCNTYQDFLKLNELTDNFIVGSDQVFRYKFIKHELDKFLLGFTNTDKKRISVAASFGITRFSKKPLAQQKAKLLFNRFDAISVREKNGVDIFKKTFSLNAKHILDPVFWVGDEVYDKLIDKNCKKYEGQALTYILGKANKNFDTQNKLEPIVGQNAIELNRSDSSIEEFLTAIKTCKFLVTNSFHGVCFAILFNTPFVFVGCHHKQGDFRTESILEEFGLERKNISENAKFKLSEEVLNDINWDLINKKITKKGKEGMNWLDEQLKKELSRDKKFLANETKFQKSHKKSHKKHLSAYDIENPKYSLAEKIFSVKNLGDYKVFNILGMQLKIKRKNKL